MYSFEIELSSPKLNSLGIHKFQSVINSFEAGIQKSRSVIPIIQTKTIIHNFQLTKIRIGESLP